MEKYILTDETKILQVIKNNSIIYKTVHRIKALDNFGLVRKGDLGGWVESYDNLSHTGNCWIFDNAAVIEGAFVFEDAMVSENAVVSGRAQIYRNVIVSEMATISGNAVISDNVHIFGNASISENAHISGSAKIMGEAKIFGDAEIGDSVTVSSNAKIGGIAHISGKGRFFRGAYVMTDKDHLSMTTHVFPCKTVTFYRDSLALVHYTYQGVIGELTDFKNGFTIKEFGEELTERIFDQANRYFGAREIKDQLNKLS